jgi:hypothetical protein
LNKLFFLLKNLNILSVNERGIVTIIFFFSWLSDSQFCKVVEDTSDYVECACSHMSVYAVYAQTDNLSSYNEAFFSSGFICVSGQWQYFQSIILIICENESLFPVVCKHTVIHHFPVVLFLNSYNRYLWRTNSVLKI